jgi:uncharacterized coiled-coil protein SlyX
VSRTRHRVEVQPWQPRPLTEHQQAALERAAQRPLLAVLGAPAPVPEVVRDACGECGADCTRALGADHAVCPSCAAAVLERAREHAGCDARVESLEGLVADLRGEIDELETANREHRRTIESLERELELARTELDELRAAPLEQYTRQVTP